VRLEEVEALVVGLTLRAPVRSAGLVHGDKTTLFLRVRSDAGSGWGECVAYPDARDPDPSVVAVEPLVVDAVVQRLAASASRGEVQAAEAVYAACRPRSVAEQAVTAALEMALLDAELRTESRSLADAVGAIRPEVETGALVGIPSTRETDALLEVAQGALDAGARRLRVKIEPGWDHRPLGALRERYPDAVLQADANGSFAPGAASQLRGLDAYGLGCLEQPFPPDELEAHRQLGAEMATPIALDESLWSNDRVRDAVGLAACRVACLKPGRLGGVAATLDAARVCAAAGVDCFVGGFFESGLGRAVNAALAGRPEFSMPGDLGDPGGYLAENPFSYLETHDGLVALSRSAGLGVVPFPEVLEACTIRSRSVRLAG
jgi:o-succinylbenzoate synthase